MHLGLAFLSYELCHKKNLSLGCVSRSDKNQAVQLQKLAISLTFCIETQEILSMLIADTIYVEGK